MIDSSPQIELGGRRFDPLTRLLDDSGDDPEGAADVVTVVVQLQRSPTRDDREILVGRFRLRLVDYIPEAAYIERIPRKAVRSLAESDLVRAVVPFLPEDKLDPAIGTLVFETEERKSAGVRLVVVGFEWTDAEALAKAVADLGLEVTASHDEGERGLPRLVVAAGSHDDARRIAELESVRHIEEVGEVTLNNGTTSWVIQSNTTNSRPLWGKGLRGEGQIIGHIDGALDINHCFFEDLVDNTPRPAHRKVVGVRNVNNGTVSAEHGTFSAGNAAGEDVNNDALSAAPNANNGNAPRARLSHGYLSDLDFAGGTESFFDYLVAARGDDAHIHTNSWDDKSTRQYTQLSVDADRFTWENEDELVIIGPNNRPPICPPDTAKNPLVVNATDQSPNQANYASGIQQFTVDGRRKPDVMAPGRNITSADAGTACGTRMDSGTSFAAPAVAGLAALVRQYYMEGWYPTGTQQPGQGFTPSGALVKATLINSAVDATGIAGYPGAAADGEGWGRVLAENALYFDGQTRNSIVWDVRNIDGLQTGESVTHHVDVAANTEPLRIVLAWTEPPGAAGSATPVINNLDLTVTSPDGSQVFRGNQFSGGVSVTGGTADALNNVEVVLVTTPAVGDWTVSVAATTVNVGAPGQGYSVVAAGNLAKAPAPTGNQDTLIVRVAFSDIAFTPPLPGLMNTVQQAAAYIGEVSYGTATVLPTYVGPIALDHNKDYYAHPSRNMLIELTQEVVGKLVAASPTVFDRGTGNPADDIDRMVIVTNDVNFTGDWATTGPWPYDMPAGLPRPLSVSIQSYANPVARFAHGLCHQFGLVDLYAHPGVVLPRPYVDEWDNMAGLFTGVHPLVWSKQRAGWLSAHGSEIRYVPRPGTGLSYAGQNPIPLFYQTSTTANLKAIAIGLSQGAATIGTENAFYFIEARNAASGADSSLPASGVIGYYVNELVPQGEGPVIVLDRNPGTNTLADAAFGIGDSRTIPGTGITFTVVAGTGGAPFGIQLTYAPPITDYNVSIVRGDTIDGEFYRWFSPDIWIDSPKNGYQQAAGPLPSNAPEAPVANVMNRLYARIHNAGPGTAFDFDVRFRISEPYHTVGGEDDFNSFVGIKHVTSLPPGPPIIVGPVEWTPNGASDPHNCVLVDIINLVGTDTNPNDNSAQENFNVVASTTASPYTPVEYRYGLTNPYDHQALFYFRVEGAPADWDVSLTPAKILLNPREYVAGSLAVKPPDDAEPCVSRRLEVTSWTPRGDTIVPVGGAVLQVDLRRRTELTLTTGSGRCDGEDLELLFEKAKKSGRPFDPEKLRTRCRQITAKGCTNPPLPFQEIIVKFTRPDGAAEYHTVVTDENGCYEDFMVTAEDGNWSVQAEYPGDKCQGPVTTDTEVACGCGGERKVERAERGPR
jgi:M6 family metalloprotease-like protein